MSAKSKKTRIEIIIDETRVPFKWTARVEIKGLAPIILGYNDAVHPKVRPSRDEQILNALKDASFQVAMHVHCKAIDGDLK